MRIQRVVANQHSKMVEVRLRNRELTFPFALLEPAPSPDDRIERIYVDPELGREGFTHVLESGAEGSLHVDSVLEHNRDPAYLTDLLLHQLTVRAQECMAASPLSLREVVRRLGTSASQLYRLLDSTNRKKSIGQMVALLSILGCEVGLEFKDRTA